MNEPMPKVLERFMGCTPVVRQQVKVRPNCTAPARTPSAGDNRGQMADILDFTGVPRNAQEGPGIESPNPAVPSGSATMRLKVPRCCAHSGHVW